MLDDELLDHLQRGAFDYFADQVNPANGLVADTSRTDSPASIAVVGFALSVYPVAVERGWLTRDDAAARTLVTLRFFATSAQGPGADAIGYKGFYLRPSHEDQRAPFVFEVVAAATDGEAVRQRSAEQPFHTKARRKDAVDPSKAPERYANGIICDV